MGEAFLVRKGGGVDASDATAIESDIISGKTAYIDDSGEAKVGTMPVISPTIGDHLQTVADPVYGAYSGDTPSKAYLYTRLKSDGQPNTVAYTGVNWVRTEESKVASVLGITPERLVKGVQICGVTGTMTNEIGVLDFPLTISMSQPSPQRNGHVWIKTTRLTAANVLVRDYVDASIPDGVFVLVTDTNTAEIASWSWGRHYYQRGVGDKSWLAGSNEYFSTYLPFPRVYSKVNGVIYIENAYVWDGSKWLMVSNSDKYFYGMSYGNGALSVCNINNNSFINKATGISLNSTNLTVSKNGEMMASYSPSLSYPVYVVKRTGDTFTNIQTISNASMVSIVGGSCYPNKIVFSRDANYMIIGISTSNSVHLLKYRLNSSKTGYDFIGNFVVRPDNASYGMRNFDASDDLSTVVVAYYYGAGDRTSAYVGTVEGGWTETYIGLSCGTTPNIAVSPNGVYAFIAGTPNQIAIYINKSAKTALYYPTAYFDGDKSGHAMAVNNDGEVLLSRMLTSSNSGFDTDIMFGHGKIAFNGSAVSFSTYVSQLNVTSQLSNLLAYRYLTHIVFNEDKSQCYGVVVSGNSTGSSTRVNLIKLNFASGGGIQTVTQLSSTDLSVPAYRDNGYLIGY